MPYTVVKYQAVEMSAGERSRHKRELVGILKELLATMKVGKLNRKKAG